jgi:rhodanese-related sulfurtransferase
MRSKALLFLIGLFFVLTLVGCGGVTNANQVVKPETKAEALPAAPAKSVKQLIEEAKFEIVDFSYVKAKIGDGLRKFNQVVVIDARPKRKYDEAHVPSAINIPDNEFDKYYPQLEQFKVAKDTEIITYCGGFECIKSYNVAKMLRDKGYSNIKIYLAGDPDYSSKSYMEITTTQAIKLHNEGTLFVDARPEMVYKKGTIPGSVNIPDMKFVLDQTPYMKLLPQDQSKKIVVFCGGYACVKSHVVADILYQKGYKGVVVYAGGLPEWQELGNPVVIPGQEVATVKKNELQGVSSAGAVKPGKDEGTVDKEFFKSIFEERPDNIVIVDVRGANEYANVHIKGAINIPVDDFYKKGCDSVISRLPKDKNIIFVCSSGGRSGEMWYALKDDCKYNMKNIYFYDGKIDCTTGKCELK